MSVSLRVKEGAELVGIDEVAVVRKGDAIWRVDVEGLRLCVI